MEKKAQLKAMQYLAKIRPETFRLKFFSLDDKWEIVLYEKQYHPEGIKRWAIFWKVAYYLKGK
jgi:hypothetical protein